MAAAAWSNKETNVKRPNKVYLQFHAKWELNFATHVFEVDLSNEATASIVRCNCKSEIYDSGSADPKRKRHLAPTQDSN